MSAPELEDISQKDALYWKHVADDLTRLIQKANAPIFGIDTEGKVSEWNEKTEMITGCQWALVNSLLRGRVAGILTWTLSWIGKRSTVRLC